MLPQATGTGKILISYDRVKIFHTSNFQRIPLSLLRDRSAIQFGRIFLSFLRVTHQPTPLSTKSGRLRCSCCRPLSVVLVESRRIEVSTLSLSSAPKLASVICSHQATLSEVRAASLATSPSPASLILRQRVKSSEVRGPSFATSFQSGVGDPAASQIEERQRAELCQFTQTSVIGLLTPVQGYSL